MKRLRNLFLFMLAGAAAFGGYSYYQSFRLVSQNAHEKQEFLKRKESHMQSFERKKLFRESLRKGQAQNL